MKLAKIKFDPSFIEEVVFLSIREAEKYAFRQELLPGRDLVQTFLARRNQIYEESTGKERDEAFKRFYEGLFSKIGLRSFFENIFLEFPLLGDPKILIFVKRVWCSKEEGAELYMQDALATVFIGLQTIRVKNRSYLEAFLFHELMRVSDMLDPSFVYSPHAVLGGECEMEDNLIRDRFRILWDLYIDSRMRRMGLQTIQTIEGHKKLFEKAFVLLNEKKKEKFFESVVQRNHFTHKELLKLSRNERLMQPLGRGGQRCPLCHFPSHECIDEWEGENRLIAQKIKRDRPDWEFSMGVCRQCYEIYRSELRVAV